MVKYVFACILMLGVGFTVDAAPVVHRLQHTTRHYSFRFTHTPTVVVYGQLVQYQQFGLAVVGYSDLVAVQDVCTQHGFQIVRVNPVQQFVVVRLPAQFTLNTITTFSRANHVRFIEPAHRNYR